MLPGSWFSALRMEGPGREDTIADLTNRIRFEQIDFTLQLAPFTVLVGVAVVQVTVFMFWGLGWHTYLCCLEAMTSGLAALILWRCWVWRRDPEPQPGPGLAHATEIVALLFGTALASMTAVLFAGSDTQLRLLLACSCAGLIATGVSASSMPRVAMCYSVPIIVGGYVALWSTGELFYHYIALLLSCYAIWMLFTVHGVGRIAAMRVMAQFDLERQQELTSLLLNDFEESASDWLWETDPDLRLQHVSARLIQVTRSSETALRHLPFGRLLAQPNHALWEAIAAREVFRGVLVPVQVAGDARWWLLSGKPVLDGTGAFRGYRGVGSDVTEKKRSDDKLSHLAMHDSLTDLPNRVALQARLEEAGRTLTKGGRFAVLYLDVDEFKSVNDSFGHAAGDALLQAITGRLRAFLTADMLLARLAGDEFVILWTGLPEDGASAVALLASGIVAALGEPFELLGIAVRVGVSIGIALAPQDGNAEIVRRADLALYRAKSEGRHGYRFYEDEMDQCVQARRVLLAELHGALARQEFALAFQPLVRALDARIQGFEALLRWNHPVRGLVPPDEFILLAEENGLIVPIGEWVLREACKAAVAWTPDVVVAVNLSAVQLRDVNLPCTIAAILRESGLAARRLELEITESVYLDATAATHAVLRELRSLGVRLALDDFGTGYSSLSYLRRVTFDKIKIDRSFVQNALQESGTPAIIRAIVDMAAALGITVTAEGVETEAQYHLLQRQGCHQMQGYLFGRPVSAETATLLTIRRDVDGHPVEKHEKQLIVS